MRKFKNLKIFLLEIFNICFSSLIASLFIDAHFIIAFIVLVLVYTGIEYLLNKYL